MARWVWSMWMVMQTPVMWFLGRRSVMGLLSDPVWRRACWTVREWSRSGYIVQGFRVVQVEECWFKSLAPLMAEVRAQMGSGPVYLSFDTHALDPGLAPGTGTPEIAGLTPIQGVGIIRGCRGLNLVGCDLVEVSPAYDTTGNTALTGANLLFEMLCVLPKIKYY